MSPFLRLDQVLKFLGTPGSKTISCDLQHVTGVGLTNEADTGVRRGGTNTLGQVQSLPVEHEKGITLLRSLHVHCMCIALLREGPGTFYHLKRCEVGRCP